MTIKNERRRKVLSFVLSFAMVVCMMPAFHMTVYADSTTYTVSFNTNGHGTAPTDITDITSGTTITEPTAPTAEGFTFGGWYKEEDCTNQWDFSTDTVTANTTLYAKWTAQMTYILTIPATVNVSSSGYNAFENGIKISKLQNLEAGKDGLEVTASSENNWRLKDASNEISYGLRSSAESDNQSAFRFSGTGDITSDTGETQPCGIYVDPTEYESAAAGTYSDVITWTVDAYSENCILAGSMITLADGSQKMIDDVTMQDKLMTFSFYKGATDGNYPLSILKHENKKAYVITITLDNGTVLEMCDWQQYFDMDAKAYFDIDTENYADVIGRHIMYINEGIAGTATIVDTTLEYRVCTSYEIFTEYNKNFVANGILTLEPGTYLDGVYTIGDDLKINQEIYQADVRKYGRYTYEQFAYLMSENGFNAMNIADRKIAVGKGIISEEELFELYEVWLPIYRKEMIQ